MGRRGLSRSHLIGIAAVVGVVSVFHLAALGVALVSFDFSPLWSWAQPKPDARFAEFTEYVPEPLEIQTDVNQVNMWMPGLGVSSAYWVAQYEVEEREVMPYPDRPVWWNGVLRLELDSSRALDEVSVGGADLLPAIYTDLHGRVPVGCSFTSVPTEKAEEIAETGASLNVLKDGSFHIEELAVSRECTIAVVRAVIHAH